MTKLKVLILAGKPVGLGQLFTGRLESPLLIPYHGKPLVMHFEDQFRDFEIIYALGEKAHKTHSLIRKKFSKSTLIKLPEEISNASTGDCLLYCLKELDYPDNILTVHGDNIYQFEEYPNPTSRNQNYTHQIEMRNSNYTFYSNLDEFGDTNETLHKKSKNWVNTGAHFIQDSSLILRSERVSIDSLIQNAEFVRLNDWIDLGHWDLINRHNISLHARSFNTISINSDRSSLRKLSGQSKILREFTHLNNIPEEFTFLFPRVRALNSPQGYEIEYWPLKSLSEYYVFWNQDFLTWSKILSRLLQLIDRFSSYEIAIMDLGNALQDIYLKILDERISQYSQECLTILKYEFISINGMKLKGFEAFSQELRQDLRRIGDSINPSFYHGDLCLSNILYCPESEMIKLIDPKGSLFPESSNCGDFRYDLAKLYHSVIGNFDYFNWSMFSLLQVESNFVLNIFKQDNSEAVEDRFRQLLLAYHSLEIYKDVEILTAMLFLTMVPLHSDSDERQKVLLLQAISMLNHIYPA
jgi:hypothetical protein